LSNRASSHYHVVDTSGGIITSNLTRMCLRCAAECVTSNEVVNECGVREKRRRGRERSADGEVFLCTNDRDQLKSARLFKREIAQLASLCKRLATLRDEISRQEAAKARRLLHNLITLNGHALQDLYSFIPQDDLANFDRGNFRSQQEMIRSRVEEHPEAAARLFIMALKNEGAVKNELSVFKKIYDGASSFKRSPHSIHKVILNVANYFFQDFADKNVRVHIEPCVEKISVDYESVQVALYHIFDNAAKYCARDSVLKVSFTVTSDVLCALFDMQSFYVMEGERSSVFNDDFSGEIPRVTQKAGLGMGMGLIRELLIPNCAEIDAQWGNAAVVSTDLANHPAYAHNTIIVRFRNRS